MNPFVKKKLIEENLASKLSAAREDRHLSLEEVSAKISIKKEYLLALEQGNYELLPGGVYEKIFLKKYSAFLGLDAAATKKEYSGERKRAEENKDVFARKKIEKKHFLVVPKILKNIGLLILFLALLSYLVFCLKTSLSAPKIKIFFPPDNLMTTEKTIEVFGQASEKTQITINDKPILKSDLGIFKENVELKTGLNSITISAKNKYGSEQIIKKQILVK